MPDITITVTANQAQRIAAAFGPPPAGVTQQQWVIQQTKAIWKDKVKAFEASKAANDAFDISNALVEGDFAGF